MLYRRLIMLTATAAMHAASLARMSSQACLLRFFCFRPLRSVGVRVRFSASASVGVSPVACSDFIHTSMGRELWWSLGGSHRPRSAEFQ